jgi:hypothetical protein
MQDRKKEVWSYDNRLLEIGNKVKVVKDIEINIPNLTSFIVGQGVTGIITGFTEDNQVEVDSKASGKFISDGKDLEKITLTPLEKDLIALLKDITYQTGYMTNSWGDTSMLSQMAIEDQISPWSIEKEVTKFAEKYDLQL